MWNCQNRLAFNLIWAAMLQLAAATVCAETWNVSLSTTGDDVFWTSPTAVATGFPEYDWSYEITEATAYLSPIGSDNLLDYLEDTSGSGTSSELPVVLVDSTLSEDTTGSSAEITIGIDAAGFGYGSGTNITLGSVLFFRIRQVDFEATISVIGIPTGDYNRNGDVDEADYAIWRQSFGSTSDLAADGNGDLIVDAADYTLWRDNLSAGGGAVVPAAVPEPATCWLGFCGAMALVAARSWRKTAK